MLSKLYWDFGLRSYRKFTLISTKLSATKSLSVLEEARRKSQNKANNEKNLLKLSAFLFSLSIPLGQRDDDKTNWNGDDSFTEFQWERGTLKRAQTWYPLIKLRGRERQEMMSIGTRTSFLEIASSIVPSWLRFLHKIPIGWRKENC